MPVPERVPVQDLVLDRVPVLVQGLRALEQAALAWVLDQGRALAKAASDPVALKDRTATDLVMEPAIAVLVRQTEQALAPVWAGMDPAPVANNTIFSNLL